MSSLISRSARVLLAVALMALTAASLRAEGWTSPTSYSDPDSAWADQMNACDGTTSTYARNTAAISGWGGYIEYGFGTTIYCSQVRVTSDFGYGVVDMVDLDIKSGGTWTNVFEGSVDDVSPTIISFTGANITDVRYRFHYTTSGWEFWLYEISAYASATPTDPTVTSSPATSVWGTTADLHAQITDAGGAPCEVSFEYGTDTSYGTTTAWAGALDTNETAGAMISGLSDSTTYHYRARARNVTGTVVYGADRTFATNSTVGHRWIAPNGITGTDWLNGANALDDETASSARCQHTVGSDQWSPWLTMTNPSVTAEAMRLIVAKPSTVDEIDVQAYIDGSWVDLYTGSSFSDGVLQTYTFSSPGTVTQTRVKLHVSSTSYGIYWNVAQVQILANDGSGTTAVWDGGGSTNNWSEAANWSTDVVPSSSDAAVFNDTSTKNATVDYAVSVAAILVDSGYTGAITQSASVTTSGDFALSAGTWSAGSQSISIGGDCAVDSTATFSAGSGTVSLTGSGTLASPSIGNAFYNLTVGATGQSTTLVDDVAVTHLCTVGAGTLVFHSSKTLHLRGSGDLLSVSGSLDANSPNRGVVSFEATSTTAINVPGLNYGYAQLWFQSIGGVAATFNQQGDITAIDSFVTNADSSSGSVTWDTNNHDLTSASWLSVGNWGDSAGGTTINAGSSTITGPSLVWFTTAGDVLNMGSSHWIVGAWALWSAGGTVNVGTSKVTTAGDIGPFWTSVPQQFYDLEIVAGTGTATMYGDVTVAHDLTITSGTLNANSHDLAVDRNISVASGAVLSASGVTINLSGTGNQSVAFGSGDSVGMVNIASGSRTVTFTDGFTATSLTSAGGPTLVFGAGQTFNVTNLTLNGTSAAPITVASTSPGTASLLNVAPGGSQAVAYVAASDSNASGGQVVDDIVGGSDGGGLTNWLTSGASSLNGDLIVIKCHNGEKICCKVCGECPKDSTPTAGTNGGGDGVMSDPIPGGDGGGGGGGVVDMRPAGGGSAGIISGDSPLRETYTPSRSFVDELGFNYYHMACDYRTQEPGTNASGCASCGARPVVGEVGPLERLTVTRIHRYRDFWIWSSLGQGVFLDEFDFKLQLVPIGYGGGPNIWYFDPRGLDHYHSCFDSSTPTGIYHDGFSALRDIRLYDGSNTLTADQSAAVTAVLTRLNGEVYTFEVIKTTTDPSDTKRDCRLISHADRNGNALTITYVYPADATDATLGYDRTQLWKINTVTDPHGSAATFTYGSSTVNGRWVVTRIDLPNSQHVSYTFNTDGYGGGWVGGTFRSASLPDGSTATVTTSFDSSDTQNLVVHFTDNAATDGHVAENVYITMGSFTLGSLGDVINQPAGLVKRIYNGAGELTYRDWEDPSNPDTLYFYRGGGRLTREITSGSIAHISHGEATAPFIPGSANPSTATFDVTESYVTASTTAVTQITDALSRVWQYTVDLSNWMDTAITYPDSTSESFTYNAFRQVTQHIDRIGRETDFTYDSNGNVLSKTVAVGTAEAATWSWTYNTHGQPITATDADGNETNYTYDSHGYLATITEPADFTAGTRAVWTYVHDAIGRLTSVTDPNGRETDYAYDARNRLTTVTYADASTEVTAYGSSGTANLVTSWTDRNGHIRQFGYDADGRLTSTTWAYGLPEAISRSCVYLNGTTLPLTCVTRGDEIDYTYDQRLRRTSRTVYPNIYRALTTTMAYDAMDRLLSTTDPYGRASKYVNDVNDRRTRTVHEVAPGGLGSTSPVSATRITTANPAYIIEDASYDAEGEITSRTDGRAIVTTYGYDHQGRLTQQIEAYGTSDAGQTEFSYDAQGNRTETRWPRHFSESGGFKTDYTYTHRNLLASMTEAVGRTEAATTFYLYTLTKKRLSETDGRGFSIIFSYCSCCDRLEDVEDQLGYITHYEYDNYGNVTSITDPNSNVVSYTYDGLNRAITMTRGASGTSSYDETTSYTYDDDLTDMSGIDSTYATYIPGLGLGTGAVGSAMKTTDPEGDASVVIRDGIGRVVRTIDGNGNQTTTAYDTVVTGSTGASGNLIATTDTDALDHSTSSHIDGLGLAEETVDAQGKMTKYGFDADGNQVKMRDPNAVGDDCVYDNRNRRTGCTDTHGDSTGATYDAQGNMLTSLDGLSNSTSYVYDGRNRKTSMTDRVSGTSSYTYDADNDLTSITDAEGGVTTYAFDHRDLLASESFPGTAGGTRTYTYDAGRRLATRTDQASVTTTLAYDHSNRLTARQYPDGKNDAYTYDHASRFLTATSNRYSNTVSRTYDPASRLTEESLTVIASPTQHTTTTYNVFYGYDNANRMTLIAYPDGKHVTRTYTSRNQLDTVAYDSSTVATRTYDDGMRLSTSTAGNGLVESRAYRNDLSGKDDLPYTISIPGVTSFTYSYDANKRITSEVDGIVSGQSQSFSYDNQDRLTSWSRSAGDTQTWSLSLVGDWNATSVNSVSETRTHNSVHEITAINSNSLTYDAKGNLTADNAGASYTWDIENRLASAAAAGGIYAYDAFGRRVQKTVDGLTTTYVSAGAQEIWEVDTDQSVYDAEAANGGPGTSDRPLGGILTGSDVVRVNFQPSSTTTPTGFLADTGAAYGLRAGGAYYGWQAGSQSYTAERDVVPLVNFDTLDEMQHPETSDGVWEYALANGDYPVVVVMGDASNLDMVNDITIEGGSFADPDPYVSTHDYGYQLGDFDGYITIAHITDGKLTIAPDATASNAKICFVEIGPEGGTINDADRARLADLVQKMTDATAATPKKKNVRSNIYGSYVDELLMFVDNGVKYYLHSNRLYSVAAATDTSGSVMERYKYDAYGKRSIASGSGAALSSTAIGNDWGFTGRRHDEETGLVYLRKRYFSSSMGRFISRDPWMSNFPTPDVFDGYLDGLNLYMGYFIPNDVDPLGLFAPGDHHQILQLALADSGLTQFDIDCLKKASDQADTDPGAQSAENSYKHGMASPGQTPEQAKKAADDYVNQLLDDAVTEWCRDGRSGDPEGGSSCGDLGRALHTIMDEDSPWHRGKNGDPIVWNGGTLSDLWHHKGEPFLDMRRGTKEKVLNHAAEDTKKALDEFKRRLCLKCPEKAPEGWCPKTTSSSSPTPCKKPSSPINIGPQQQFYH